jgi:hypothetical protein
MSVVGSGRLPASAQDPASLDLLDRPGRAGVDIARSHGARGDAVADLTLAQDRRVAELVEAADISTITAETGDLGRIAVHAAARHAPDRPMLDYERTVAVEGPLDIGGLVHRQRLSRGGSNAGERAAGQTGTGKDQERGGSRISHGLGPLELVALHSELGRVPAKR